MKATIRNNLKGLKKDEDKESENSGLGGLGSSTSVGNNPSVVGGASSAGGSATSRRVILFFLKFLVVARHYSSLQLRGRHQEDRPYLQFAVI